MPEDTILIGFNSVGRLKERLAVWLIVAMGAAAAGASPATDSNLVPFVEISANTDPCVTAAELSREDKLRICDDAQRELAITQALLGGVLEESVSSEVGTYLDMIAPVLAPPPDGQVNIETIAQLVSSLSDARRYLTENASSFGLWLRVMGIQDPEGAPYRVPPQFVRVMRPEPEEFLTLTDSEIDFHRSMEAFLGNDANTESSFG